MDIMNRFKYVLVLLCGLYASCTKYDTPESIAGGIEDTAASKKSVKRYVLWLNIDGAVGSVVKQEVEKGTLPVMQKMLGHSKYVWTGVADDHALLTEGRESYDEEDPLTWATMLTGMNSRMHRIKDYSYTPDFMIGDAAVTYAKTLVQYVSDKEPNLLMSCISPWPNLNRYVGGMQSVITSSSDEETLEVLQRQLEKGDNQLTLAAFKGVLEAGKLGGFVAENASYLNALKLIDTGLGQLLAAIEAREDAYYEDWLVCVTSNHGGTPDGRYGGNTDPERDIFGIFYYPHYTSYEMKGEVFYAARFSASEWATAEDTTALYGIGNKKQLSIEMNMRNTPTEQQTYNGPNWTYLVGKGQWGMFRQRDVVKLRVTGNGTLEEGITACNDDRWHSLYLGMGPNSGAGRMFLVSYDGRRQKYEETSAMGVEDDSTAVVIGRGNWAWDDGYDGNTSSTLSPYYVASLRLWDTQLEDVEVDELASLLDVPADFSARTHLIGEWRFSPEELENDSVIPNRVEGMPDFVFKTPPVFVRMANTLPKKLASGDLAMENILIAPQVIYWLCGADAVGDELDGHCFLSSYMMEEQWRDQ